MGGRGYIDPMPSSPTRAEPHRTAYLLLEDGRRFDGLPLGHAGVSIGEVVFNTSMTGYQEVLTDPSYAGQLVTMTYPLIGNYGTNREDSESARPQVSGFIVREAARLPSSWRSRTGLDDYLSAHRVVGIQDVDTRALTRHIRSKGAMRGGIEFRRGSLAGGGADLVMEATDTEGEVYYRIQGPTLIIEFSSDGEDVDEGGHYHSIYRDPTNEYGGALSG